MTPKTRSFNQDGKRMLFVLPPGADVGRVVRPSHHPIMTATLAAVAIESGACVGVIDAALNGLTYEEVCQQILSWGPEWVGFIPFEYRREIDLDSTLEIIQLLRAEKCNAEIGMLNASLDALPPRIAVEKGQMDFASFGDGEPAVAAFAQSCQEPPPSVVWNRHGYLEENSDRPQVEWENLPVPAWFLFEHQRYRPSAHRYRRLPILPIFASRACPYGCDFCPQSLFNPSQKHSARPPQKVAEEIVSLQRRYKIRDLEFYDPTFGIRREETLALCKLIQPLNITWACYTRCDLVDDELLLAMSQAGCHTILFGVESADEDVRGRTNKELGVDDIHKAFSLCKKYGIQTIASFILGLPKETEQSIQRTLSLALDIDPTYAQFHLARAFFAHEDWTQLGDVQEDWSITSASVNGQAYIPKGFTEKSLQRWLIKSYASFYLRPSKLWGLARTLRKREDVYRNLRGIKQISQNILGGQ